MVDRVYIVVVVDKYFVSPLFDIDEKRRKQIDKTPITIILPITSIFLRLCLLRLDFAILYNYLRAKVNILTGFNITNAIKVCHF